MTMTTTRKNNSEVVIVALDFGSFAEARQMVDALPDAAFFKVGMELFYGEGEKILDYLKSKGKKVFLDLKLNDIPNTLRGAARSLSKYRPELFTVFTGPEGVEAVLEGFDDVNNSHTRLLNVTVLTSAQKEGVSQEVLSRARQTLAAKGHGVVSSAQETALLRKELGDRFLIVNPGIRPAGSSAQDQKRVATPREAFDAGATYIVVGRPITQSADPAAAFGEIINSLA